MKLILDQFVLKTNKIDKLLQFKKDVEDVFKQAKQYYKYDKSNNKE